MFANICTGHFFHTIYNYVMLINDIFHSLFFYTLTLYCNYKSIFMMKQIILLLVISFIFSTCKKDTNSISSQPNILFIIGDDIGLDAMPGYSIGATKPLMPNLQQLMSNGLTFDNVWSFPVCSPTRSSILTGRYGYRTGVLNAEGASTIPASEKTLQAYLDEQSSSNYSHAIIGKWHLSNNEPNRPTQMGVGYYAGLLGGAASSYTIWPFTENGQTTLHNGYITTKITDLAIDWINQQNEPWFCWLAYTAPHTPFHLPPDSMHTQGNLPTDTASINANPHPYFMAMLESIDYEIGRLLNKIPSAELSNTIIIFIGDNGTTEQVIQSPYAITQSKGSLFQGGVHVPMIIAGKGVSRINERDNNLISTTDLFSTIAEIGGVNNSMYEDSYSFKHLLTNTGNGLRLYNYSEVLNTIPARSGYTIRDSQYKLIQFDSGQQNFYDLLSDAYEKTNLLNGTLTTAQNTALQNLINQANAIRQ